MGLLEPFVIPGFDRVLVKLLVVLSGMLATALVVIITSIVGVTRAVRRRRRRGHSVAAVMLGAFATAIPAAWLLYWVGHDIHDRSNPINGLLAINFALCMFPLSWLIAAIRANRARPNGLVSQ
jgi:uncharacterized membrane protein YfcA